MNTRILLGSVVMAAGSLFSASLLAADVPPPDGLVHDGQLTYGTAATFAPFEYMKDQKLTGFDIELGQMIADRMGLEVNPFNVDFKGLIPALQGKRVDIINSAMYINEDRAKQVDFVPYLTVGNEVIVRQGNPAGIDGRDSICGHSVAVTLGGIQESYAVEDNKRCLADGKPEVDVMTFPTAQMSAMAVAKGRAEAFYNSTPGAAQLLSEVPDTYEIVGDTFKADTQIGIAVRKGDEAMASAIEQALKSIVASGDYDALIERYNLPPSVALLSQGS
ncbi:ABC transporter substrate-binding protein [Salinicola rhizosphaerae]|uniref:Amino acid ABC transporter n=1 Tax=Salinicola rhizosphaerae TaxID=1443141 RepID=A0ABQ3DVD8_9GAMM|nr:ABC transporter substrate-binding protein [Salinicola rhizosphaerae]GHB14611.1 amino acid ABC transporter [Salinicola rhizosphaerae]